MVFLLVSLGSFAGDFAAISALRAAALRRLRSETSLRAQCGRRPSFSMAKKKAKRPRGRLRMGAPRPYSPFPGPRYEGRPLGSRCVISGAQNLSGWSQFPPGHRALGLQKLPLVRFHDCAWFGRTGDSWSVIAGRSGTGPYRRRNGFCIRRRGGYQPPVQPSPSKGADSPYQGADSPCQGEMAEGQKG